MIVKYYQDDIILQPETVTGGYDYEDMRENCVRRMPIINWMPYDVYERMCPMFVARHYWTEFYRNVN